jgi:hypothetical protein
MATFTISVEEYDNQPPSSVDDGADTINYGETLIYTRAMFTFTDLEGNDALNLKVLTLPAAGLLKLNSVDVTVNQIISFANIDSGLFTYVPDNGTQTTYDTTFTFSLEDDGGSGIFVG